MTDPSTTKSSFRRSKKLIEPRIQIRFGLIFLAMAGLAAMVQSIVMAHFLTNLATEMPTDGMKLRAGLPEVLSLSFLVTFFMLAPLMLVIGVRSTFKIVGPLYRFRVHLQGVLRGEQSDPCRIRKDDELQEFCSLLNEVTEPLRTAIASAAVTDLRSRDLETGTEQEDVPAPLPSRAPTEQSDSLV